MTDSSSFFSTKLMTWHYTLNIRTMPWKGESDPYKVWLSEIILQQTRVAQGLNYYLAFIQNFPTVFDLAKAPEDEVLKLWEGLGYYSRARNLHFTAQHIVNEFQGVFPNNYNDLLKLKGVGPYTAAAISSFVFKEKVAVVDGNVIRVLARFFAIDTAFDTTEGKKEFAAKANQLIVSDAPDKYNQAIMDFGSEICKPKKPLCDSCPLAKKCKAFKQNRIAELPFRLKRIKQKKRFFISFLIEQAGEFIIEKRSAKDIWAGLYQLPLFELDAFTGSTEKQAIRLFEDKFEDFDFTLRESSQAYKQKLTHQQIEIIFHHVTLNERHKPEKKYIYTRNLTKFAFPKIFILYLQSKSII